MKKKYYALCNRKTICQEISWKLSNDPAPLLKLSEMMHAFNTSLNLPAGE